MNTYEARIKPLAYWFGRQTIRLPHWLTIVVTVAFAIGLVYQAKKIVVSATSREAANKSEVQRARMSDEISVRAAGRGNPRINLSDGHELVIPYSGPAELTQLLELDQARPLSLCSADFDEDGVPDLISGYAGPKGGIITLLRGNVDSIYPNAPEAKQRKGDGTFTEAPFLSPAFVFGVPEAADFIGAGDFDGDGHWDVVCAKRGSNNLNLLSGDGRGGLRQTKSSGLPGDVTAMVVGEINRRDGLDDIVVGVSGEQGSRALVFEGPEGALRANPEIFDLPAEASSLALGQLDDSYEMDLAVAAGNELIVIHGRDRELSLNSIRHTEVKPAVISRQGFPFAITSIALGDFSDSHTIEVAVLSKDGTIHLLSPRVTEWSDRLLRRREWSPESKLVCSRVTSVPVDNLVLLDSHAHQLHIIADEASAATHRNPDTFAASSYSRVSASLEAQGEPVAVLPMRLNPDALSDLVIASGGSSRPVVVITQAAAVFRVTNTNDSGDGSLRKAIQDANANPGADSIEFNIQGTPPFTITPASAPLPFITDPVTIDGTTQPGFAGKPIVELNGEMAPSILVDEGFQTRVRAGLYITAGNSRVRGLVINRFAQRPDDPKDQLFFGEAIALRLNGSNIVEGNFIGTNVSGKSARRNDTGVFIADSSNNNLVGGTTANARNLITGNRDFNVGIFRESRSTQVQGNFIGTNVTGAAALPDNDVFLAAVGVSLGNSFNATIGGQTAGASNIISGGFYGIFLFLDSTGSLVQGNHIGTDVTGTVSLANFEGVHANEASGNTIGGTTDSARNVISGNDASGIFFGRAGASRSDIRDFLVQGNFIGADSTGARSLSNGEEGIFVLGGAADVRIEQNRIAFNQSGGVVLFNSESFALRFTILSNSIFANRGLGIDLGSDGVTQNDNQDPDDGPNTLQNFPVLISTSSSSEEGSGGFKSAVATTISGTFNSTPNRAFTLQFFFGSNCDGSGHQFTGAIPIPLQPTIQVTTDSKGDARFTYSFDFPASFTSGFVNSTTTDPVGNTSEFSACIAVTNPNGPRITSACKGDGKQLIVNGTGFVDGARVFLNGDAEKTQFVSSTQVIAFKAGKRAVTGDTVKVRNPDATETPQITYTRVNCSP